MTPKQLRTELEMATGMEVHIARATGAIRIGTYMGPTPWAYLEIGEDNIAAELWCRDEVYEGMQTYLGRTGGSTVGGLAAALRMVGVTP